MDGAVKTASGNKMPANGWRKRQIMQWIPSERIRWDSPCYKCRSHFCDGSCKEEPAYEVTDDLPLLSIDGVNLSGAVIDQIMAWGRKCAVQAREREWVSLTEEEIDQIYCDCHSDDGHPLSLGKYERALEAKLREKNNG